MFTLDQIQLAHSKVKSGADFPSYISEMNELGVLCYEVCVKDGHAQYFGADGYTISGQAKYNNLVLATECHTEQFKADLKAHQEGKTDYITFCNDCAKSGVQKWVMNLKDKTCTYFSIKDEQILIETIPG